MRASVLACVATAAGRVSKAIEGLPLITRPIPSTGEQLPVIGLGTNAYSVTDPAEIAVRRAVLQHMPLLGGAVIDTARQYGRAEVIIGRLLAEMGNRDKFFLATKTPMFGDVSAYPSVVEESFRRLQVKRIDLMQVHNLNGVGYLLPMLQEYKQAGRIRYIGISVSEDERYPAVLDAMRRFQLDFIQVDYSLVNRGAEREVLPRARDRGVAVLANMPLGGRHGGLIRKIDHRTLPAWANEVAISSWPQLLLKYVVSHPGVTAAIPGTTRLAHLRDNQQAGRGTLLDVDMRKRLETLWDDSPELRTLS